MKTKLLTTAFAFLLLSVALHAQNNQMWALTRNGGAYSSGSIVSMDPANGNMTIRHSFMPPFGYHPYGNLLQANDGNLYGTCYDGGQSASCTLWRFDPATNIYTDVYDFDIINGDFPTSGLIQGPGPVLYGVATAGGASYDGVLYSWNTSTSTYTVLYSFNISTGSTPYGAPVLHSDGLIYGMTEDGGTNFVGVLYSFNPVTSVYTVLYDFDGVNGATPDGSLIEASDGKLYGMTRNGGINQDGILFSYDPVASVFTKIVDFTQALGINPQGSLIEATSGLLYGTTTGGGANGNGTIFRFNKNNNVILNIHDFDLVNGSEPIGDLYQSGNFFYGTTFLGGTSNYGTAFKLEVPGNNFTKLYDFTGLNGSNPTGAFIIVVPTGLPTVQGNEIKMYPNPTRASIKIELSEQIKSDIRLTVYDLSGKTVMDNQHLQAKNGSIDLEVGLLKSGTYLLQMETGETSYRQKFIKN